MVLCWEWMQNIPLKMVVLFRLIMMVGLLLSLMVRYIEPWDLVKKVGKSLEKCMLVVLFCVLWCRTLILVLKR